jgi:hypothetical protein
MPELESIPIPADQEEIETCSVCESQIDACNCWHCEGCGATRSENISQCSTCEQCESCCDCWTCSCCESVYPAEDSSCECCDRCESCCHCSYCDSCDTRVRSRRWCSDCDHCNECCICNDDRLIKEYSTDVLDFCQIIGDKKALLSGIELEVQCEEIADRDTCAESILAVLGTDYAILKEDSSIGDNGFEIVSTPCERAEHEKRYAKLFDARSKNRLRNIHSWKSGDCGMHVHLTRAKISPLTLGKMLVFLNDESHSGKITRIAGRSSQGYCKRYPKKISDALKPRERHEAINLTNSKTIEIRIFRGTLNRESFFKNLEFCYALVSWAQQEAITKITWLSFRAFVLREKKSYPFLFQFIQTKGI